MSAKKVCTVWKEEIKKVFPNAEIKAFPACDGGEGTVENITEILRAKTIHLLADDANRFGVDSTYAISGRTAFIAVANTSGLPQTKIKDPKITTTLGFGQQIKDAISMGCERIYLSLGGSSTNDAGVGAAYALGADFTNKEGISFLPTGGTLREIEGIETTALDGRASQAEFFGLCDVSNPLTGPNGCSYVYAKQKGAETQEDLDVLEENMKAFAAKTAYRGVSDQTPGTGAAGGLGYFVKAFLGGELISGADFFLDLIHFDDEVKDADYILCGEGKFDATSDSGKICGKIIDRAAKQGKKTTVFCGIAEKSDGENVEVYEISDTTKPLSYNLSNAVRNLRLSTRKFLSFIK